MGEATQVVERGRLRPALAQAAGVISDDPNSKSILLPCVALPISLALADSVSAETVTLKEQYSLRWIAWNFD